MISLVQAGTKFQNSMVASSYSKGIYMNHQASAEFLISAISNHTVSGIYIGGDGENIPMFGSALACWNDIYGNGSYNISNSNPGTTDAGNIYYGSPNEAEITTSLNEAAGTINHTPRTNAGHTQLYTAGPPMQEISLAAGWNSLSSYITPDDPTLETIFASLADELIIVQTTTRVYYPGENINTIGDWPQHAAFIVKTTNSCTLQVFGETTVNRIVDLVIGWNL